MQQITQTQTYDRRQRPDMKTIFHNARISTGVPGEEVREADSLVAEDSKVVWIGSGKHPEFSRAKSSGARCIDVQGQRLMPAFFDSHVHLLHFGVSTAKINIRDCKRLDDIRKVIREGAAANPQAKRLLVRGWMRSVSGYDVDASTLDAIESRPVYIDSDDLHACWCNSAALKEINAADTPDPPGGRIVRDNSGKPTGIIEEAAVILVVWGHIIGAMSVAEKKSAIRRAVSTYNAAGYTSVVDMAMDEDCWNVLCSMRDDGELTLRLGAHFIILPATTNEENAAQVDRVIELHMRFNRESSPDFWIAGIKIISDGVVDGCTAALSHPYLNTGKMVQPMWTAEALRPVLHQADAANLQCAIHAIGDEAVSLAVNSLSSLATQGRRHRIEHLELTKPEDARKLGELGITASIQPVHCDPEYNTIWPPLIGHDACKRAWAYSEFLEYGAKLAIGTDTPTAPHVAFNNIYNAITRRSFRRPSETETINEHFKIALDEALCSVSYWPAYASFAEDTTGALRIGKQADLIVVDSEGDWIRDPTTILKSKVTQTWLGGQRIFSSIEQSSDELP